MTHGTVRKDRKAIGQKWVLKVKHHRDGQVERYKCRLIAKDYSQKYGVNYDEYVFTYGTSLSIAVQNNLHVHQMNVVTISRWTGGGNLH